MSEPYVGEIRIFGFNFAPRNWAMCNGQTMSIQQNAALFSILGTTYGGNGTTTFQLPNLQGSVALHVGPGFTLGQIGGEAMHTLVSNEMPIHTHLANGSSANATASDPTGSLWAAGAQNFTTDAPNNAMNAAAIGSAGGSQPHENRSPYLAVNFCISLFGVFPSRN